MKLIKKILILTVASVLFASTLFGCGSKTPGGTDSTGKWRGDLKIVVFQGGYEDKWLRSIAAEYKAKNPRVNIKINTTPLPQGELASLESGVGNYDIYFMIDNMFNLASMNKLADLTDVYKYVESGQDKSVMEKMNPVYVDEFNMKSEDGEEDKFYLMPWSDSREGLIYNKSVTDKYFGNDFTLPRTSDELVDICGEIKEKNTQLNPFIYSGKDDYLPYLFVPWWAQYEGLEAFQDYFNGYKTDSEGNRTFCKYGEVASQKGRLYAWQALEELCKKSNGYSYPRTEAIDYNTTQMLFLGQPVSGFEAKDCVFSLNGEWLENEAKDFLEDKPQEIRYIRTPVLSKIIEKTPSIKNDEELRLVVDYVDGLLDKKDVTKPSGVTEEDVQIIYNARKMVNSVGADHVLGVNGRSVSIPLAKDFLKFLTTKKAGEIYSKELNGLQLPYGAYNPLQENVKITGYVESKYKLFNDSTPIYQGRKNILVYRGGMCAFKEKFGVKIFTGEKSGKDYFDDNVAYITGEWNRMLKAAGLESLAK